MLKVRKTPCKTILNKSELADFTLNCYVGGIKTWVFLGPLIPEFTDTKANLEVLFRALKGLDLDRIYVDRLNPRWGVLAGLCPPI